METARSALNELRWRTDRDFSIVEVEYVHRGAPGDLATVRGDEILALEPWMMVVRRERGGEGRRRESGDSPVPGQAAIPYHRILRICYEGVPVFSRTRRVEKGPEENKRRNARKGEEVGRKMEENGRKREEVRRKDEENGREREEVRWKGEDKGRKGEVECIR